MVPGAIQTAKVGMSTGKPNKFSFNVILKDCGRAILWSHSVATLQQMYVGHVEADVIARSTAVGACSRTGRGID